ncbi:MAG TPA: VCBS repeat-containing protein [Panacibacter sp.]|nr:VCBS repeat-containing protein [Panacibacter sp.]HNP43852.1 VCBS repeat-containing protein [Panacibacter sp.]
MFTRITEKYTGIYLITIVQLLQAFAIASLFAGCKNEPQGPLMFEALESKQTGLNFSNRLTPTNQFNVFHYMYYYNGAGVGAGDFNNDGLVDLFFASNQGDDKLFLNEGKLHFKDVTADAKIPEDGGWSTGVSVVDINNDGLLDIYVCRVGKYEILNSHNQFLICKGIGKNGIPFYEDESKQMGLDFSGFSTQAAFLDYDMDGDLDMYLLNHSLHQNGSYGSRTESLQKKNELSGDRIYNNDHGIFKDVTASTGINSSVIGYGLGICVADINLDGYPDIYIGNDFQENDYLYLNQHNGTFNDVSRAEMKHTSQYTMGVDVADLTNDGLPEIMTLDMLPYDPYILKRSGGADQYDISRIKQEYGYGFQETRNNLQFNRGNGNFSEVGLYAGIAATDWSWSSLLFDFDNDGYKDIFVANGIPKRLNDIDYINYVSNDELQMKIWMNSVTEKDMALIDKFPQIKVPNKFFRNTGQLKFADEVSAVGNDIGTYSNGAVYADFDNDGDLDVVVNNIEDPVLLYENKHSDLNRNSFLELKLNGPAYNINANGAKVLAFVGDSIHTYEKYANHGFLSSMEIPVHIAIGKRVPDSVYVIWPDNSLEKINWQADTGKVAAVSYKKNSPQFNYALFNRYNKPQTAKLSDITDQLQLHYKHQENDFVEFDREPLMPHMVSTEGPALAIGDMNGDGLDDIFVGSAKRTKSAVFLQQAPGKFTRSPQPALDKDSVYEDVDACWVDVNNDKKTDLVVCSGGNEYFGNDAYMQPRVYLNDGNGNLVKEEHSFDGIFLTGSCVAPYDFNGDGFVDLFVGARAVPKEYGKRPASYLLLNDGTGKFKDVTAQYSKEIGDAGFITAALWFDIDKDGDKDLLVAPEWGSITAYINNGSSFTTKELNTAKGWWNCIIPFDADNDGDIDIIAGNLGLNSRLQASAKEPVRLYYNDFDDNGTKEQVLTYYLNGKEICFAGIGEVENQMPELKKKFLYAEDFAKASLDDIFGAQKLANSKILTADYFQSALLINKGNFSFEMKALPWQTQLSTIRDAVVIDANHDGLPDILTAGNFYDNNIGLGRYDADYGGILVNKGSGNFEYQGLNGLALTGQVRHIKSISIANKQAYVVARNNDSLMVITPVK